VNLLLVEPEEVDPGGHVRLEDPRRVGHLRRVLGVGVGDRVRAGIIKGPAGRARVLALDDGGITLQLEPSTAPPSRPAVDLVLALPRPKALRRVLRAVAELGVGRIDLVNAWRVDRSYWGSPRLAPTEIHAALHEGCEQAGHTWLPAFALHPLLMPFFEDELVRRTTPHRLLLHPGAPSALEEVAPRGQGRQLVAIGPERGWTEAELQSFGERGFAPVTLGDAILRTEVAVAVVLGQLQLLRRLAPRPPSARP
jgi:RsmE family RNA methyltransferase